MMFTSKVYKLLIFFIFFSSSIIMAQTDHKELFEKAKYTMETKGDLQSAINLFEKIIEKYPIEKEVGAKSQFYIGLCYQKLGFTEAKKAFEKVINNYPTETEIVSLAKQKLLAIKVVSKNIETSNKDFQLQQVWEEPYDSEGNVSPDGKYVSYVNWNVPCLAIYDLNTGKSTNIVSTKGTWEGNIEWAESSIWSFDGKKLVYVWYGNKDKKNIYDSYLISLRTVGIDSSEPVEIFADEKVWYPHPCSWSKDGKYILASLCYRDDGHEMILISVKDHSRKSIKRFKEGHPIDMSLSPDGKYVVYTYTPNVELPQTDISIISTVDGKENVLINHQATDFNPLWMPDGKSIIFFSDRTGTVSVLAQEVNDGKAVGEEKIIKNLNRLTPQAISNVGELFMTFHEGGYDVYNAEIDPKSGKVLSFPKRVIESNIGWNGGANFSPDGKKIAYVSQRGVLDPSVSWGQQSLIIRDLQTGNERQLTPKLRLLSRIKKGPPRWSPNGDEIVMVGRGQFGHIGAFILNVLDASCVPLFDDRFPGSDIIWSNNKGQLIYYQYGEVETEGIYLFNRELKESTKIFSGGNIYNLALHPDGEKLAFVQANEIKILDMDDYETKVFYKFEPEVKHTDIAWAAGGKWLYFIKCFGKDTVKLCRIDFDGNNEQLIDSSFPHLNSMSFHPNGKRLAFTVGKGDGNSSLWVMKYFMTQ